MDILEQFLNSISFKFPKGYPNINDPIDFAILKEELANLNINLDELNTTKHWNDRTNERGNILDITNFPQDSTISKEEAISQIENELKLRCTRLEKVKEIPLSFNNQIGYKIMKPVLTHNGKNITLNLKVKYVTKGVEKINNGFSYIALIDDNNLITLMLLPQDDNPTIELALRKHMLDNNKPEKEITILTTSDYEFFLSSYDTQPQEKTSQAELPYKIKTSYRPGSIFTHNQYGQGKIVTAASAGTRSGEPDSRGIVDWVEVDFGKPYLSGGKLKNTRIFNKIYTSLSPEIA